MGEPATRTSPPGWFDEAIRQAMRQDSLARIAAMPPIRFICERDVRYGPDTYAIGLVWSKNPDPPEGEYIYRRRLILRLTFRLSLERW